MNNYASTTIIERNSELLLGSKFGRILERLLIFWRILNWIE